MQNHSTLYRLACAIALIILSMNIGAPALPTQARSLAMNPQTQSGGARFKPLTKDSPLAPPYLNARPALDREAARGNSIEQQRRQLQAQAVDMLGRKQSVSFAPVARDPARVQTFSKDAPATQNETAPAPVKSLAGMPAPSNLDKSAAGKFEPLAALNQAPVQVDCYDWLENPTLDNATGWLQYWPIAAQETNIVYSEPTSLRMKEFEAGDSYTYTNSNNQTIDVDSFGQVFYFPSPEDGIDFNSLQVTLQTAELGVSANDYLYAVLYNVEADNTLGTMIDYSTIELAKDGNWSPHTLNMDYGAAIQSMKGKSVALVIEADTDNATDSLGKKMDIAVDDVNMRLCTSTEIPTGMIYGTVTQTPAADMSDTMLMLTYQDDQTTEPEVLNVTLPDIDGFYYFDTLLGLPTGGSYQVWFMNMILDDEGNLTSDDSRLMLWAGPRVDTFANGDEWNPPTFDISDVGLVAPADEAEVVLKDGVTFEWAPRDSTTEQYYHCLYDEESELDYNTVCTDAISGSTNPIDESSFSGVPGFLNYDHHYWWYVMPYDESTGIGYSYYAQGLTFVTTAPPVYNEPDPSGDTPDTSNTRPWLLMIYLAGDNNLGDPNMSARESSFHEHFKTLQQVAPSNPNVHVVVLADFLDGSGTQLCYLSVTPAQCEQLGEKNTGDPAELTSFINTAEANFPHTRSALMISDHGHGISGMAVDETTLRESEGGVAGAYIITANELHSALANAGLNGAGKQLDLLYFNNCLMGNLESAWNVREFAKTMVAASNEMWMMNIYAGVLPLLTPTVADRDLAIQLANAYANGLKVKGPGYSISIAAYDLAYADSVRTAVSNLGNALYAALHPTGAGTENVLLSALKSVRAAVQVYDSSGDELLDQEDAFVDLYDLASRIKNAPAITDPNIKNLANAVLTAFGNLVIGSQQQTGMNTRREMTNFDNAHGLSVYFPDRNEGTQLTFTNMLGQVLPEYVNTNGWVKFTNDFISAALGNPTTEPGGGFLGGPVNVRSRSMPPSGQMSGEFLTFLSVVRR